MTTAQRPSSCKELNREMARAAIALVGWIDQTPPEARVIAGAEGWSVKDHIAHLDAWLRGMVALLNHRNRVEAMELDRATYLTGDADQMNAVIYRQHRAETWDVVWDGYMETLDAFSETLASLDDADLQRTYADFQPDEPGQARSASIVDWIVGNSYDHIYEHLPLMQEIVATHS